MFKVCDESYFLVLVFDECLIGLGLLILLCLVPEKTEENKVMSRVKSVNALIAR